MKKKLLFLFVLFVLFALTMSACGASNGSDTLPYENGAQPTYTALPTYTPYPTQPAPDPVNPTATQPAPASGPVQNSGGSCEGIHDYQLLDLTELSADVEIIHIQYGRGGKEYESLLPAGRYMILRPFADGHVWELGPNCSPEEALMKHVGPSITRRTEEKVNTGGYVYWEDLINDGTLSIVWQKMPVATIPTTLAGVAAMPTAGSNAGCFASQIGVSDTMTTVTAPAGHTYSVEAWGGNLGDAFVVVPAGESVTRSWQGGAIWDYPCSNTSAVIADVSGRGKPVMLVQNGTLVKQ